MRCHKDMKEEKKCPKCGKKEKMKKEFMKGKRSVNVITVDTIKLVENGYTDLSNYVLFGR